MNLTNYLNLNSWLPFKLFWLSELPSLFLIAFSSWRCSKNCPKEEDFGQHLDGAWWNFGSSKKWVFCLLPLSWPRVYNPPRQHQEVSGALVPMLIQLISLLFLLQSYRAHESRIRQSGSLSLGWQGQKLSNTWDVYKLLPESFLVTWFYFWSRLKWESGESYPSTFPVFGGNHKPAL